MERLIRTLMLVGICLCLICSSRADFIAGGGHTSTITIDLSCLREYAMILVWSTDEHDQLSSLLKYLGVDVPVLEIDVLGKHSMCQSETDVALYDGNCRDDGISNRACTNLYFCEDMCGNNTFCDWLQEIKREFLAHSLMARTQDVISCIVKKFQYKRIFHIIEDDSSNEWYAEIPAKVSEEDEKMGYRMLRVHVMNHSHVTTLADTIKRSLQNNIEVIPVFFLSSHSMLLLLDLMESYVYEQPHTIKFWLQTTRFFVLTDKDDLSMDLLHNHPFIPWNIATIDITHFVTSLTRSLEFIIPGIMCTSESPAIDEKFPHLSMVLNISKTGETNERGPDLCCIQSHLIWGDQPSFLPISRAGCEGEIFPMTKYGLNQRQLIVLIKEYPPYVMRHVDNGSVWFDGISVDTLDTLSKILNFTYILREPTDDKWGSNVEGHWTGIVGQLARKEADLTTLLSVHAERSDVIDFTYPYAFLQSHVWLRRPPASTGVRVFSLMDYYTVILLMTSLGVTISTLLIIDFAMTNRGSLYNKRRLFAGLYDVAFSQFGSIFGQPIQQSHVCMCARTLLSFWWMFRLILAVTFTGVLIANLAISKSIMPFTTLEELAQQNVYSWGTLGNAFLQTTIQNSNLTLYQRIWKGMETGSFEDPTVLSGDLKEHFNKVASDKYAYLGTVPSWEVYGYDSCEFVRLHEEFLANRFAFALQKDSPLTAQFSLAIIRMEESGYMTVTRKQWLSKSSSTSACGAWDVNYAKPISLDDVENIFIVVGAGLGLAFVVFIIERLIHTLFLK